MVTFSLGVPHTPWRPERVASYDRLMHVVAGFDALVADESPLKHVRTFAEREPNHVWSKKLWSWAAETNATHLVQLQDDARVPPFFWAALSAMVEAVPDQVIGLEVVHPAARALAAEGRRWFTTSDCLVGVGYVMPRELVVEFLAWRASALVDGAVERINEDTLIGLWCLATGRRIWHPLPTIVDHDTTLASTYGNDAHGARRPLVRWDTTRPAGGSWGEDALTNVKEWRGFFNAAEGPAAAPYVGRFPGWTIPDLARQVVKGFTDDDYARAMADDGATVVRRAALRQRLEQPPPKHLLYVATPTRGHVRPEYVSSIAKLIASTEGALVLDQEVELRTATLESSDVVRRRSRMVRAFLATTCTHLLFVDDDIEFTPAAVFGMLASGHDVVACPYPKRDGVDWASLEKRRALEHDAHRLEHLAYKYALALREDQPTFNIDERLCAEVAGVALGCALISRAALERMVVHFGEELGFSDEGRPTVALFQLLIRGGSLLSEDYSFCRRWRDMGGTVHVYLGDGSPVTHHGTYAYRGHIEAFGLWRA